MKYAVGELRGLKETVPNIRRKRKGKRNKLPQETASSGSHREQSERFSQAAKQAMRKWLVSLSQGGIHQLRLDFYDMKGFVPNDTRMAAFMSNLDKCRYKDIKCWDGTRVVLKWPSEKEGNFIHANWVKHELLDKVFICAQGPTENTASDFWRMVWQEHVKEIIMLCRIREDDKEKCYQYWPRIKGEKMTYKPLVLTAKLLDTKDPDYNHTKIELKYGDECRRVQHRQWTTWPDKSVPKSALTPFRLLRFARKHSKFPTVIHCSAGVGRTGTLIMIELLLTALKRGLKPDFKQYLRDIRSQRSQTIQVEEQYVYVHYAVAQFLWLNNIVSAEDIKGFTAEYLNYLRLLASANGTLPIGATSLPRPCDVITECKPIPLKEIAESAELANSSSDRQRRSSSPRLRRKQTPSEKELKRTAKTTVTTEKEEKEEPSMNAIVQDGGATKDAMVAPSRSPASLKNVQGKEAVGATASDTSRKKARPNVAPICTPEPKPLLPAAPSRPLQVNATGAVRGAQGAPPGDEALKNLAFNAAASAPKLGGPSPSVPQALTKQRDECARIQPAGVALNATSVPAKQNVGVVAVRLNQSTPNPNAAPFPKFPMAGQAKSIPKKPSITETNNQHKFVYEPPKYYTVKTAGSQKAYVYERGKATKFVRVSGREGK
ncbi:Tyrosine-protein phosphatase non-receptor type 12 [Toxocara canis]|uniref:Tyrosine-protein phosphatase non-receptor type 12 n=1 Tax=Toxocara canis TaxID=6265 RepID=A0A0B2W1R0_TOXCA|nr:Tyrosine-protein phosphatase non-receptor type 12 [Toxocara canis]